MRTQMTKLASLFGLLCRPFTQATGAQQTYAMFHTPLTHIISDTPRTIDVRPCTNISLIVPFCGAIKHLGRHEDKIFSLDIQRGLNTLPDEIDSLLYIRNGHQTGCVRLDKEILGKMHDLAVLMVQNDFITDDIRGRAQLFINNFPARLFSRHRPQDQEQLLIKLDYMK